RLISLAFEAMKPLCPVQFQAPTGPLAFVDAGASDGSWVPDGAEPPTGCSVGMSKGASGTSGVFVLLFWASRVSYIDCVMPDVTWLLMSPVLTPLIGSAPKLPTDLFDW